MAQVTFTTRAALVAGNPENINDVTNCLDKLQTGVNAIDLAQFTTATLNAFLKLNTAGDIRIAYGRTPTGTFGGTQTVSLTVAHGLPVTPAVVVAICDAVFQTATWYSPVAALESRDATNLNFRLWSAANLSIGTLVNWVAIG